MLNFIFLLLFINMFFIKIKKSIFIIYFNCIITLIFGLRYDMGIDYLSYEKVFYENVETRFEYGYILISNFIKNTLNNFVFLTLITVFLQVYFFSLGLKKRYENTLDISLGYFFLFADKIFFTFLNTIRAGIATSIFFFAMTQYKNKKKYLLWILIASLFHRSVLIVIPITFILDKIKITKKKVLFFFIVIMLLFKYEILDLYEYIYNYIPNIYKVYDVNLLRKYGNNGISLTGTLSTLFKMILFYIFLDKKEELKLEYKLIMFGLGLRLLSMKNFIYIRIGGYFDIFFILFLIDIVRINLKGNIFKKFISILILMIFSIFYLKTANFEDIQNKLEYKSIFMK